MRNRIKTIVFFLFTWFMMISCNSPRMVNPNEIDHITFVCIGKGIETSFSIKPSYLLTHGRDTVVRDQKFIELFAKEINKLKPASKSQPCDFRTAAIIHTLKDSIIICFGEFFGTECNGVTMRDRKDLFRMIDYDIYGPHDNYYWFDNDLRSFFKARAIYDSLSQE